MRIEAGVFAHDEARSIGDVVRALAGQVATLAERHDLSFVVLANGCSDDTADVARRAIAELGEAERARFRVVDYEAGGKSRTWNRFVHEEADAAADALMFVDGDIELVDDRQLARMADKLASDDRLVVVTSRPEKDTVHKKLPVGPVGRLINAFGGTRTNSATAIAGSLYMVRKAALAPIWMPVGLPVEDGFLRAMLLTDLLTRPEQLSRIGQVGESYHLYESLSTIEAVLQHQTRIVLGAAINKVVFTRLNEAPADVAERSAILKEAASDEAWLGRLLAERLPDPAYGYVPRNNFTKRFGVAAGKKGAARPVALAKAAAALPFDALVHRRAVRLMANGTGAGYW